MKIVTFLGSVYFAIILITLAFVLVIAGTFLESMWGSHQAAAQWIYSHPVFAWVLVGFFINILFALYKRRPLKKKHLPFILAHIGLLMVISGVLLKLFFGVQGTIQLLEGTGTNEITLNDTFALAIKKRGDTKWERIPIVRNWMGKLQTHYKQGSYQIEIHEWLPHVKRETKTWIKGDRLFIMGHPPYALNQIHETSLGPVLATRTPHEVIEGLLFVDDGKGAVTVSYKDPFGKVYKEAFDQIKTYYAYDDGFLGHTVVFKTGKKIPRSFLNCGRCRRLGYLKEPSRKDLSRFLRS